MDIVVYNIRRIMEEKGLKQKYVAEKSGCELTRET